MRLPLADRRGVARGARRRASGPRAGSRRSSRTSSPFPGTDSEHVRSVLQRPLRRPQRRCLHGRLPRSATPPIRRPRVAAAACARPGGARGPDRSRAQRCVVAGPHVLYGNVISTLNLAKAKGTPTTSSARSASRRARTRTSPARRRSSTTSTRSSARICRRASRSRCRSRSSSSCSSSGSRGR